MEWSAEGYAPTDYTQMTGHCHAFFFSILSSCCYIISLNIIYHLHLDIYIACT